jgi:tRNA A-37 threonylcarbamoyl transferase component Bud32
VTWEKAMAMQPVNGTQHEQALDEILTAYLKAVDAGLAPDRRELLARHPELAADLERFFADQDAISRWTEPLRGLDVDTPPDAVVNRPDPPLGSFGDFELLGVLGRGGMGAVYKARQRSLNRCVALKVVRSGELASSAEVRRFRIEAEVVAGLEHPNIVPVHDVGERDGLFYLSMRLVEGGTLAQRLEELTADPRTAARLMVDVALAVHFAHQRGVLHRDLKPGNILLDADGRPLVADFGLARRVEDDSSVTQSGAIVGTPSYMAPEQASGVKGSATTAADVWGLGAVLYALLTGRPPFRGDTVLETLEQVKGREPEPPGRLKRDVDCDLETVCLKCLEKDPQRRYASAEAFGADLDRWLRGEPIQARAIGRFGRLCRLCRRNPVVSVLVSAMVLVLLSAVAGLAGGTWLFWQEGQKTKAALARADAKNQWARRAVNDMYTHVAEQWLVEAPHMDDTRRQFLEKALAYYEESVKEPATEPEDRLELGRALRRMADLRARYFHANAESNYRTSADVLEKLTDDFPDTLEYHLEFIRSTDSLGRYLNEHDKYSEAEAVLSGAVVKAKRLSQQHPEVPECCDELANALSNLSGLFLDSGRSLQARDPLKQAQDIQRQLLKDFPARTDYRT